MRARVRLVAVPQHADVPGSITARPCAGRETYGPRRAAARCSRARKPPSIAAMHSWYGSKKQRKPQLAVARSLRARLPGISQPSLRRAEGLGVVRPAVAVDDQSRVAGKHRRVRPARAASPRVSSPAPMSQADVLPGWQFGQAEAMRALGERRGSRGRRRAVPARPRARAVRRTAPDRHGPSSGTRAGSGSVAVQVHGRTVGTGSVECTCPTGRSAERRSARRRAWRTRAGLWIR